MMSRVRARDTQPEIIVRSTLHRLGFRFRLQRSNLPGKPDIVLPRFRTAIFVHGCFWHQHQGCPKSKRPKTNLQFWTAKLDRNIARDSENLASLFFPNLGRASSFGSARRVSLPSWSNGYRNSSVERQLLLHEAVRKAHYRFFPDLLTHSDSLTPTREKLLANSLAIL